MKQRWIRNPSTNIVFCTHVRLRIVSDFYYKLLVAGVPVPDPGPAPGLDSVLVIHLILPGPNC